MKESQAPVTTLVLLAAGRGTRFGGAKQFAQFGRLQKTLMEYNIAHAIDHGINHLVFITQPQYKQTLTEQVIAYLPDNIDYNIVYQDNQDLPNDCSLSKQRTKPLGTAHALWCARKYLKQPFVVINADDYYGAQAFEQIQQHGQPAAAYLVGYLLEQTLSAHGGVNRGLCQLSADNKLQRINEITNIHFNTADQLTGVDPLQNTVKLAADDLISMNFWCFTPAIFPVIERLLCQTFSNPDNNIECYLPDAVMKLIEQSAEIEVLTSHDQWFGVTYAADSHSVNQALTALTDKGHFPALSKIR